MKGTLGGAHKMIQSGLSADTLIASLVDHLRNLLILRTCGPDEELVDFTGVPIDQMESQAKRFDPAVLSQDIAILEELRRTLRGTQAGRALLDATLVRLALADQFVQIEEALDSADDGAATAQKKKPELAAFQVAAPPATATVAPATADEDENDDLPAPGKVWVNTGPSLSELLRQQAATTSAAKPNRPLNGINGTDGSSNQPNGVNPQHAETERTRAARPGSPEPVPDSSSAPPPPPAPTRPPQQRFAPAPPPPTMPDESIRITPELRKSLYNEEPLIRAVVEELGGEIVKIE